ncbi:---NA--- [Paramuricea clavata]|uniref:---NA n=1 Tax=Paramuricea clavata TaxID=317549 RepID=A0A7D9E4R4_PARCT|nr:---NA--- [Paramuricea clavata]
MQKVGTDPKLTMAAWENDVKGNARKITHRRKKGKFTQQQKTIVEKCFDEGEQDKKKRYTTSSCQKLMSDKLGQHFTLTENQIASYWSNYRKRKREGSKQKQNKKQKLN